MVNFCEQMKYGMNELENGHKLLINMIFLGTKDLDDSEINDEEYEYPKYIYKYCFE